LANLSELLGGLLLAAIGLDKAMLEGLILPLEVVDDLLKLRRARGLAHTHPGNGQRPEGSGKCFEMI
jgi:hypothetical protein